jgi:hypothetical protein
MRFGYYDGFEAIGLRPAFVGHSYITAAEVENPVYLLTWDDYNYLDDAAYDMIKCHPHVVMVNPWFRDMGELETLRGAPRPELSAILVGRIIGSEPNFVWGLDPPQLSWAYGKWEEVGCRWVSLPWACNTKYYHPSNRRKYSGVKVGFVGSYRTYKTWQYEDHLWPYEDDLHIWSHSPWPRCYRGPIPVGDIHMLYQNAIVCPTISEPLFGDLWITPERPFAVLGSGGLTVLDCNPSFRYFFSDGEVLMPETVKEYCEMMDVMLHDEALNRIYRESGYNAVMERHTFAHRARRLLERLGND